MDDHRPNYCAGKVQRQQNGTLAVIGVRRLDDGLPTAETARLSPGG
jgi:hypothetical protein